MFSLWRKARRENSAASRLLGSTSLRFALHGWQRRRPFSYFARRYGRAFSCLTATGGGLPSFNYWSDSLQVSRYTTESFSEAQIFT
ncbi:hypothetical protein [Thiolapillus sp.]|uniref:hypothetical protein n=1 Tax=Thiolapillus sp. TaxID=2017437 RepID=UPI0025CC7BC9|nr:hypothetical protein [Thiolapillus sp.]